MAETREVLIKVDIDRKGADKGLGAIKTKGEQATKSLKDTQKSAKDTGQSLTSLAGDTKFFGVSVNSLSAGFTSMRAVIGKTIVSLKIFKTALISTGIGALIIAAGALIVFLTRMQSGMDVVSKAMAQLGAVMDVILDRMAALGKVIIGFGKAAVKALKFDFVGAMEAAQEAGNDLKEVFVGMGEEIAKDVRLAGELADAIIELELAEIGLIVPFAKIRKAIAQNLLDSKDQAKSAERRLQAVKQAALLEEAILTSQLNLQQERVRLEQLEFDRALSDRKDERKLNEEKAKLFSLEEASLKKRASIAAQIEKFTKAVIKEEKEAAEARKLIADFEELQRETAHVKTLERLEIEVGATAEASFRKIEINQLEVDAILKQSKKKQDVLIAQSKAAAEIAKAIEEQKQAALLGFVTAGLASQKRLGKIAAKFNQGIAIRQIFIDTKAAIVKANKDIPFPASLAVGIFYGILGAASAAAVAGVQFARGGKIKSRGAPRTGDRVLIRANPGEVVLNEPQQAALGGASTFRKIGVPGFQGGGVVPGANISALDIGPDLNVILETISNMKPPVVTVEDINVGQQRVQLVDNRAKI